MKEKLIQLATFCLNDKSFYNQMVISKKGIQKTFGTGYVGTGYEIIYSHKRNFNIDSTTIQPKVNDKVKSTILNTFHEELQKNNEPIERAIPVLTINFLDEPPLNIYRRYLIIGQTDKVGYVTINKKILFFNIPKVYTFNYTEYTYGIQYFIKSATVEEQITEEEYYKLIDLYDKTFTEVEDENAQLKIKNDILKVDERLSVYLQNK
jgi:hypothetical protein